MATLARMFFLLSVCLIGIGRPEPVIYEGWYYALWLPLSCGGCCPAFQFMPVSDRIVDSILRNTPPCAATSTLYFTKKISYSFEAFDAEGSVSLGNLYKDDEVRLFIVYLRKVNPPKKLPPHSTGIPNISIEEEQRIINSAPWVKILRAKYLDHPLKCRR
jgi:hypothetical protein